MAQGPPEQLAHRWEILLSPHLGLLSKLEGHGIQHHLAVWSVHLEISELPLSQSCVGKENTQEGSRELLQRSLQVPPRGTRNGICKRCLLRLFPLNPFPN